MMSNNRCKLYVHTGFFITYTNTDYLLYWLPIPTNYLVKLIYLGISIVFIGIGVAIYLIQNSPSLPPEGLVAAIVKKSGDILKVVGFLSKYFNEFIVNWK